MTSIPRKGRGNSRLTRRLSPSSRGIESQTPEKRKFARGKRSLPLSGMMAIGGEIRQVIDEIDTGGTEPKGQKGEKVLGKQVKFRETVGHDEGDKDQQIFQPLMQAQSL